MVTATTFNYFHQSKSFSTTSPVCLLEYHKQLFISPIAAIKSQMRGMSLVRLGGVANPAPAALTLLSECAVHLTSWKCFFVFLFFSFERHLLSVLAAGRVCLDGCVAGEVEHGREETG